MAAIYDDVDGERSALDLYERLVTAVALSLVSFTANRFHQTGAESTSASTLCLRARTEIEDSLSEAGLSVEDVFDAPDHPGLQFVFVAQDV